jgi:hypothetical protein
MALVKCLECGRDISDQALSCPHCGLPLKLQEIKKSGDGKKVELNINKYEMTSKKWKKFFLVATPLLIIGIPCFAYNVMAAMMSNDLVSPWGSVIGFWFSAIGGILFLIGAIGHWWERG